MIWWQAGQQGDRLPQIVYEDNHLLVAIKPHNMPSQGDITGDEDLLSYLKAYRKQRENKPGEAYLGLMHRLDRPAAGLMAFAKTSKCAARVSRQIQNGQFHKRYYAVLEGDLERTEGQLVDYMKKDPKSNTSQIVSPDTPGAKKAVLNYQVRARRQGFILVEIELITGRSHQIRLQFSSRKTPLVGDQKYGSRPRGNLCLFAYYLSLIHPTTKKSLEFCASPYEGTYFDLFADLVRGQGAKQSPFCG